MSHVAVLASSLAMQPRWPPTYSMQMSTIFMPCNYSGLVDPEITAEWGIADFDWSNGKGLWARAKPMDCEELLVQQAKLVKSVNPDAKVWVYRNLVKALPWYSTVREKLLDPAYSGWFLKYKPGGSLPHGKYYMDPCTNSTVGAAAMCSGFYHDREQTPSNGSPAPTHTADGWTVYDSYNGCGGGMVVCPPANRSALCDAWALPGNFSSWQTCKDAAAAEMQSNGKVHIWTWWMEGTNSRGACWLTPELYNWTGGPQSGHVMGYKGPPSGAPKVKDESYNHCLGDCDCGSGLPCGEYLWDHRNGSMLRDFLVNEFVLGGSGLKSRYVDGFYFDDQWTDKPSPVPAWAPPTYRQCNMAKTGGPTEEDAHCIEDMGLTQQDTINMTAELALTEAAVHDAVVKNDGFAWPLLTQRSASLDLDDPRPKCKAFLRSHCKPGYHNSSTETLMYEFTKKQFHDSFPLPFVQQDVAQFLLIRGAYAYIGYAWLGCIHPDGFVQGNTPGWEGYPMPPELKKDYGVPVDADCRETGDDTGVFVREWSKASVQMDCGTYRATINEW